MTRMALTLLLLAASAARAEESAAPGVTNVVSGVRRVKGWSRQYVQASPDGRLVDPSGRLVPYADEAGRSNRIHAVGQTLGAAHAGLTNAFQALVSKTNQIPERGIALRLSMKPGPSRANFYAYAPHETSDGTNDTVRYYFSHALEVPPKIQRRYRNGRQTAFVEGAWQGYSTNGVTVTDAQGVAWHGCNVCTFARPTWAVGYPVRPNRHPSLGHPASGFDFAGATVFVDGRKTLTGYVTNGTERIYFDNGVYKGAEGITEDTTE